MTLRDVFRPAPPRVPSNPEWSDEGALTAAQRDTLEAAIERGSADIAAGNYGELFSGLGIHIGARKGT
jgi:hypothetical protein